MFLIFIHTHTLTHQLKCNLSEPNSLPLAIGYTSSQLIALITTERVSNSKELDGCICLFQVPDYSVYQNKMYLSGGRPILDVWPALQGHDLTCGTTGIVIADSQATYLLFSTGTLFNIDKKEIVGKKPAKLGILYFMISSMEKMTYYDYAEPENSIWLTKNIYGGSSVSGSGGSICDQ